MMMRSLSAISRGSAPPTLPEPAIQPDFTTVVQMLASWPE